MSDGDLIKYGKYAGAVSAIFVLAGGLWAFTGNDRPPLANIARIERAERHMGDKVDSARDEITALIVRGNLLGAWRSCRQAVRDQNARDIDDYGAQVAMLQNDYRTLTGQTYPLEPCP